MSKVVSYARQLRFELQAKLGREVTMDEVAEAVGIDRRALMQIELNRSMRLNREVYEGLAKYYEAHGLDGTRVLVWESVQKNRTPRLAQQTLFAV